MKNRRLSAKWALLVGVVLTANNAFGQIDGVLEKVRQSAEQVSANNPTFYLKSARAVEPNVCLYPNGDPTGIIGPLVFRNSYVATPSCREVTACSESIVPVDDPKPLTCGAEIPNSRFWAGEEKTLQMRSDGTASLEFKSEELVHIRSCTPVAEPVLTCSTGNIGLFRSEVEYEDPNGNASRYNWDRFQNLAGRRTETRTRLTWPDADEPRKTGNRTASTMTFTGVQSPLIPPHGISARVTYKTGDSQPTIRFIETDSDITHYARLRKNSDGSQEWEISSEVNRRPSPPVTRVSFLPSSFSVSVEDRSLPDLLAMAGADAMQTSYLVTVFTESHHHDQTQIFQTEAVNTGKRVLFKVPLDQDAMQAMKGKSSKIRVHVRAQRSGSPWVDGAVSSAWVYETDKEVKFPKR